MKLQKAYLTRGPNKSDIKFGYGCQHYNEAEIPPGRKFVTLNGNRWTVVYYFTS